MIKATPEIEPDCGSIFLIQRFCTSDGPGIRTTVFMKGCPLSCKWCQNPESKKSYPELMTHDDRCIGCGKCVEVCREQAITINTEFGRRIDRSRCNRCFDCVDVCPADALTRVGEHLSIEQVLTEIEKDEAFIYRSDGGVTLSGGEPLLQGPFTRNLLKACKDRGYHTTLDTSGYAPWHTLEQVIEYADLILYDIKHMDADAHREATGVCNSMILSNLHRIPDRIRLWFRIPLIPGYNDDVENLDRIVSLSRETHAEKISLLPFNRFGEGKYRNLGLEVPKLDVEPLNKQKIENVKQHLERSGLPVSIGE
jgi:pyruvate formate lyase activating enzyme